MSSAGLSADPAEYRSRLTEQTDQQLDAWTIELMRDLSIRIGVLTALDRYRQATGLDDVGITKVFTAGGGAPASIGRTAEGPASSQPPTLTGVERLERVPSPSCPLWFIPQQYSCPSEVIPQVTA